MASKVLVSSTSANSDLTRQASIYSLTVAELQNSVNDPNKSLGSMSMDELVRNIWTAEESHAMAAPFMVPTSVPGDPAVSLATGSLSRQGSLSLPKHVGNKTVEEVWKEISGVGVDRKTNEGSVYKEPTFGEMTLEDFLAKAGIVREENVRIPSPGRHFPASQGGFPAESILSSQFQQQQQQIEDSMGIFGKRFGGRSVGNGLEAPIDGPNSQIGIGFGKGLGLNGEGPVRGKRRAVDEPVDKVAQQRQRRMIKNRESAARSRERKQAYTVELESLVTQLEEENAQLLRQQVEHTKKRLKQLMQNLIPIEEMRRPRPPRALRKTHSMNW